MKCPNCESELPHAYAPATCPACGKPLLPPDAAAPRTTESPIQDGLVLALKFIGWAVVVVAGTAMLLLALAFAGCVCSGMR